MIHPSTFSIAAYDSEEEAWGIAVASKFPGVGAVVPWVKSGIGAIATQAQANTSFGPDGLSLLEQGNSASETLEKLLAHDPDQPLRQIGIVDGLGNSATFTGSDCSNWAGGISRSGFAIQGNILASKKVIDAMEDAYLNSVESFPQRLMGSLLAGDEAGGDRRGKQSAAIYIAKQNAGYGGFNDRWIDYRVDDAQNPIIKLFDLIEMHFLYFGKSDPDEKIELSGSTLFNLQTIMSKNGFYSTEYSAILDDECKTSLRHFIGNENFEERVDLNTGMIDRPVYEFFLKRFLE